MQVELITQLPELERLAAAWRHLTSGQPFTGPDWLLTWWQHLGVGRQQDSRHGELFVLCVTDEQGTLVALAPWYLEHSLLDGHAVRFLGSGEVCSDYLTVPCRDGQQTAAARAIADWLCGAGEVSSHGDAWDLLSLENVDLTDPILRDLVDALCERGAITHLRPASHCWRLSLPGSWDEYLAMLSKTHRKHVRRLQRTYLDTGRARLVSARTPEQLAVGFGLLVDLHSRRWADRGVDGIFTSPEHFAFHRAASERLLAAGQLRIAWLELDGRPAAAEYSLVGGNTIYAYQSGLDPSMAEHEPGNLALVCMLQEGIAGGITTLDFLRGNETYKAHWRALPQPMHDVRILPGHWPGRLRQSLWKAATGAKDWLRAGRDAVVSAARSRSPTVARWNSFSSTSSRFRTLHGPANCRRRLLAVRILRWRPAQHLR